jgi:hypothetical protein
MRLAHLVTGLSCFAVAAGLGLASLAAGCSNTSSGGAAAQDAGGGDECAAIDSSACGQPCDPGNSLGIGRYCNNFKDCDGTQVPTLCATLGDPTEHFCTNTCQAPDAGAEAGGLASCGENATCQCQGGQCGCYPSYCQ